MTFKIKMLTAAAVLAVPAVAGAQVTGNATGSLQTGVQAPVQSTLDSATQPVTETVQDAQQTADEAARSAQQSANQAADEAADAADNAADAATNAADAATSAAQGAGAAATAQTGVQAQAGPVTAAAATDIRTGVAVHDQSGAVVGTIESVDADSAVVSTGTARAEIPLASFGTNGQNLVIAMTKAQLEAAVASRTPS